MNVELLSLLCVAQSLKVDFSESLRTDSTQPIVRGDSGLDAKQEIIFSSLLN